MTKILNLPQLVYDDLKEISDELSLISKNQITPDMTISILISVYKAHLNNHCARDAFYQKIANTKFLTPKQFQQLHDIPSKTKDQTQQKKNK